MVVLSGLAHISVPDEEESAFVTGGEFGMLFAGDLAELGGGVGHRTAYPGLTETVILQLPIGGNVAPAHTVLHAGPCKAGEVVGFRGLAS